MQKPNRTSMNNIGNTKSQLTMNFTDFSVYCEKITNQILLNGYQKNIGMTTSFLKKM